jgi:hypothetical protein
MLPDTITSREIEYEAPNNAAPTLPHSAHLRETSYYPLGSPPDRPFGKEILFFAEVVIGSTTIAVPAFAKVDIAKPVEMTISPPFATVKGWDAAREMEFTATLTNSSPGPLKGAMWIVPLSLKEDDYEPHQIEFSKEDETLSVSFRLTLPILKPPLSPDVLVEFRRQKPAAPEPLNSATILVKEADIIAPEGVRVGLVPGLDSTGLKLGLAQLGVEFDEISIEALRRSDINRFGAIIIGSHAYAINPDLEALNSRLLDYVNRGGALIVLNQSAESWNKADPGLAPFTLTLSVDKCEGTAVPLKINISDHPLVAGLNSLTDRDLAGWKRPYAADMPREWSSEYKAVLISATSDQQSVNVGLVAARYGEGNYVYTSYTLGHQIREMNPGALRLLANLIGLGRPLSKTG